MLMEGMEQQPVRNLKAIDFSIGSFGQKNNVSKMIISDATLDGQKCIRVEKRNKWEEAHTKNKVQNLQAFQNLIWTLLKQVQFGTPFIIVSENIMYNSQDLYFNSESPHKSRRVCLGNRNGFIHKRRVRFYCIAHLNIGCRKQHLLKLQIAKLHEISYIQQIYMRCNEKIINKYQNEGYLKQRNIPCINKYYTDLQINDIEGTCQWHRSYSQPQRHLQTIPYFYGLRT